MIKDKPKLGLLALISICIGSMIGAGIFTLPQNVAVKSGVVSLLISWGITFIGMFSLTRVFQNLATRAPQLDAGIYSYAKAAFGDYIGFSSAWGYWLSILAGNVGYLILLCSALKPFFPFFAGEAGLASLAFSSLVIWCTTCLCLRGVKTASLINIVTVVAKILPVIAFIIVIILAFNYKIFAINIELKNQLGSLAWQAKNTMLVTVWIFAGIEGANVFSARAKNRKDIGKATMISFAIMFIILFAISVLPFGIMVRSDLAALSDPSTGSLLAYIIGIPGLWLMNIALIIAVLGAFLSWVLISAEVPLVAAQKDQLFPKIFAKENRFFAPSGALMVSALCVQLYLVLVYVFQVGYLKTIMIAASMIIPPYLFSAAYAAILAWSGKSYLSELLRTRILDIVSSTIAVGYGIWLLYAAGEYLWLSSILYALGGVVFIINRIKSKQQIFTKSERLIFTVIMLLAVASSIILVTHYR